MKQTTINFIKQITLKGILLVLISFLVFITVIIHVCKNIVTWIEEYCDKHVKQLNDMYKNMSRGETSNE